MKVQTNIMTEVKTDDLVYSKKVIEFLTVANEYCVFTESLEKYSKEDILLFYQKLLPLLYLKGSLLPQIGTEDNTALEHYVTEEKWEEVFTLISKKLEKDDTYFLIDDEAYASKNVEHGKASISEKLADAYQDMKDFIMLYQKGSHAAKENAVDDCRALFEKHWGLLVIDAQRQIHRILHHPGDSTFELE